MTGGEHRAEGTVPRVVPPTVDGPRSALTSRRLVAGALLVVVVLAAVAVAVTAADGDAPSGGGGGPTVPPVDDAAADAFVDAWRRSLTGTFVVVSAFERETRAGGTFSSETVTAQRPPDRVVTGAGSVDARIDGRLVACASDPDGVLRCRDGGPAPPYEALVEGRIGRIAELVQGEQPLYAVDAPGDGCFRLRLRASLPAPPYGLLARFCFDGRTGAPTSSEIRREDSVDRTTVTRLSEEVSEEDLRLPEMGEGRGP